MGILTEATVRITPLPEREEFHTIFFPNWEQAQDAVRAIVQAKLPLSMLRLSNPVETFTTLTMADFKAWLKGDTTQPLKKFDPDQERDDHGRWTGGGAPGDTGICGKGVPEGWRHHRRHRHAHLDPS